MSDGIMRSNLVLAALLVFSSASTVNCGGKQCGDGTVEKAGVCVAPDDFLKCGVGFTAQGNHCVPDDNWVKLYCDPGTTEFKNGLCVGTGVAAGCTKRCSAPQGNRICIQGRLFEGVSLLTNGADKATPIKKGDGAVVQVFDPIAYIANPTTTPPLAIAPIDDANGCFIVETVDIPIVGIFAIGVANASPATNTFAQTALGLVPTFNQNSENLALPSLSNQVAKAWEAALGKDLLKPGTMFLWYQHAATLAGVEGVVPLQDNAPPPWTGSELYFLAKDISQPPYFDTKATMTTSMGIVGVTQAAVKTYSGNKQGCAFKSGLGGVPPGVLFFRVIEVSGC